MNTAPTRIPAAAMSNPMLSSKPSLTKNHANTRGIPRHPTEKRTVVME